jgi:hypothetical protein
MGGVALIFVLNFIFSPPLVAFIHARARWFLANNFRQYYLVDLNKKFEK